MDSVRATKGFKGDEGAIVRNEQNGGVELGEGDEFLQLWPHWAGGDAKDALNVNMAPAREVSARSNPCYPRPARASPGASAADGHARVPAEELHAGAPFQMEVRCRNDTSTSQALTVRVVDHAGFVYSGARSADVDGEPPGVRRACRSRSRRSTRARRCCRTWRSRRRDSGRSSGSRAKAGSCTCYPARGSKRRRLWFSRIYSGSASSDGYEQQARVLLASPV